VRAKTNCFHGRIPEALAADEQIEIERNWSRPPR
jgi:hypothetical protein